MTTLDPRALKPCPFCGWDTPHVSYDHNGCAWVSCDKCLARSGGFQEPDWPDERLKCEAISEWNHRVALSQPQAGEPVAWRVTYADGEVVFLDSKPVGDSGVYGCVPLYASPQPANPARVTELIADLEQAVLDFEDASSATYNRSKAELVKARAALTAAIGESRSSEPEFETAPDNGAPAEVLAYVLDCARRWVPEARIIGNARAGDIERAIAAIGAGGQAVAWWHVGKWGNGTSCDDESNIFCDAWEAAIATNLPTEIAEAIVEAHNAALSQPHPADERVVEDERIRRGMEEILKEQSERDIPFAPVSATEGR